MKVEINREGMMSIRTESPIEDYALQKWIQDWLSDIACFEITLMSPSKDPGGCTLRYKRFRVTKSVPPE